MAEIDLRKVEQLQKATASVDPEIVEFAITMLQDPDIRIRGEAFCSLILNPHDISNRLSESLSSNSSSVRAFCALILANRGDVAWAPHILRLADDPSDEVRSCAFGALGHLMYKGATDSLLAALSDDSLEVRRSALHAMILLKIDVPARYRRRLAADPTLKSMLSGL